ncbi:MAG: tRNA pseudouridine(55) synthase TruB [Crocinitomicaceae bacterium]|nr:tRNA pseudouridine(55) synthase TruB [Crocinitomicaceae bacterium]
MLDFQQGEILLIDKPLDWTSFQVVNKIRYAIRKKLGIKKIKVGHAGTLDPLATGLLVLCTGKKTKTIEEIQRQTKEYTGRIRLGSTTPSFDLETEVDQRFSTDHLNDDMVRDAALKMTGEQDQIPPSFSAKKVSGQRAYNAARKGDLIVLPPNKVQVYDFEVDCSELPEVNFRISCSKGTYIRALARDLGSAVNSGGHLIQLRRTKIGGFSVEDALTIDEMVEQISHM